MATAAEIISKAAETYELFLKIEQCEIECENLAAIINEWQKLYSHYQGHPYELELYYLDLDRYMLYDQLAELARTQDWYTPDT